MNRKSLQISRQAAPIRMQTVQKLREAIADDYFEPGERLYEKELSEKLGVSRTSFREALRQLEAEGLVVTVPNQGPIVTKVSLKEAEDIYQIRELLECYAARLFAERATDEQVRSLAQAVNDLENACLTEDIMEFLKVKTKVYDILFSGCGNLIAHSIFRSLIARVNFLRKTSLAQRSRPRNSVAEIQAMLRAIEERDPQGAYDRCLEHVRRASVLALQGLCREPVLDEVIKVVEEKHGTRGV